MGGGGVLVFQEVGTMKSLHWRCEMWFDCVKRKRREKIAASATAPRAFAAKLLFQACLRAFICTFCICVYICVCVYVCGHVYREIMLFIGKPKGRSIMISNATNPLKESRKNLY